MTRSGFNLSTVRHFHTGFFQSWSTSSWVSLRWVTPFTVYMQSWHLPKPSRPTLTLCGSPMVTAADMEETVSSA